jgi:hypothetical protein
VSFIQIGDFLLLLQNSDAAVLEPDSVVLLINVSSVGWKDTDVVQNNLNQKPEEQEGLERLLFLLLNYAQVFMFVKELLVAKREHN